MTGKYCECGLYGWMDRCSAGVGWFVLRWMKFGLMVEI